MYVPPWPKAISMLSPVYQVVLGKALGASAWSFDPDGLAVDPALDLAGEVDAGQLAQAVLGGLVLDRRSAPYLAASA